MAATKRLILHLKKYHLKVDATRYIAVECFDKKFVLRFVRLID